MDRVYINEVYQFINQPDEIGWVFVQFRIIGHDGDSYCVIETSKVLTVPFWIEENYLHQLIDDKSVMKIKEPFSLPALDEGLSKESIARRDALYDIIKKYNDNEEYKVGLLLKNKRNKLFKQIAQENNISYMQVKRIFCRFWQRGMKPNSLLDDYSSCGNGGIDRDDKLTAKPGRKRKDRDGIAVAQGIKISEADRDNIKRAIKRWYRTEEGKTLQEVYLKMWTEFYSTSKIMPDGQKVKERLPMDCIPTYTQFLYWHHKDEDLVKDLIARKGYTLYKQRYRPLTSDVMSGIIGATSQYQVDATVADIYIRHNHDSGVLGRPVIYIIQDVYSRLIAGIHIGIDGPSWAEATSCLLNMVEDKQEYCAKYGIEITEDMWPAHHLPKVILSDRGEFTSDKSRPFTKYTGIEIKHCPPFAPEFKSVVERRFGIINGPTKRFLPGAVLKPLGTRGVERPELSATITLDEFTRIIIAMVLKHNTNGVRRKIGGKEVMMVPTQVWEESISESGTPRIETNMNAYKLSLMHQGKANVTRRGLLFQGLLYSYYNPQWYLSNKDKTAKISYDPRNMGCLYMPDKRFTNFEAFPITETSKKYANWTYDEILYDFDKINDENVRLEADRLEAEAAEITVIEAIAKNSIEEQAKRPKPISKSSVYKGKRANKQQARKVVNKDNALRIDVPKDEHLPIPEPKVQDIRAIREEKEKASLEKARKIRREKQNEDGKE